MMIPVFDPLDPSNALYLGAGPHIRKAVQAIVEKYPKLVPWATYIAVVIAFVMIAVVVWLPDSIESWIKGAIAIGGLTSMYNDYRMAKKASAIESIAIAKEASPSTVKKHDGDTLS